MNWSWDFFFSYLTNGLMLQGAWTTIWLSVISMILGLGLGVGAGMMKMYGNRALRWIAEFYIWLFRGTPVLIQLIIIYTGLPQLGIRLTVIESAIIGLALNEGAYLAEVIRSGIAWPSATKYCVTVSARDGATATDMSRATEPTGVATTSSLAGRTNPLPIQAPTPIRRKPATHLDRPAPRSVSKLSVVLAGCLAM